ncbi:alpha/beta hydrolase [Cyanobium sp. Morenito 9A2]|uniref:alpha/beta hydrolase n=1 Tax=Cyanobium sp. Morenito 9A2 TaxID=2823718 RepID=UPI0020CD7DBA|nr:alpha/beta hydrolase [Cyanobium sp. Morenito 9A2]MCP9848618.1 alpha/beta hydrolase [Cyanobium sp. Morenito 9A2]
MFNYLAVGLLVGTSLGVVFSPPASAYDLGNDSNRNTIRWNSGGAVWSTDLASITTFVNTGDVTDRGLNDGISRSGWSASELRAGLAKPYSVDVVGVANFLYSDPGIKFLKNASRSYFPYWTQSTYAVESLRGAIIGAAADGTISSLDIMANLPVDYRLAHTCNTYDGKQNICAEGKCVGEAQCTSLLSWYVFLPACIQANQQSTAVVTREVSTPVVPGVGIRGLW